MYFLNKKINTEFIVYIKNVIEKINYFVNVLLKHKGIF